MNSDFSLKRMGVWTRDGGRQMNGKEIKEKVHKGRRDRKKGVERKMWDLEGPQPLGVCGRQEEDAYCSAKLAA